MHVLIVVLSFHFCYQYLFTRDLTSTLEFPTLMVSFTTQSAVCAVFCCNCSFTRYGSFCLDKWERHSSATSTQQDGHWTTHKFGNTDSTLCWLLPWLYWTQQEQPVLSLHGIQSRSHAQLCLQGVLQHQCQRAIWWCCKWVGWCHWPDTEVIKRQRTRQ